MIKLARGPVWVVLVLVAAFGLFTAACTSGATTERASDETEEHGDQQHGEEGEEGEGEGSLQEIAARGDRQLPILVVREKIGESGEAERFGGPAAEAYEDRALPRSDITFKQVKRAMHAAQAIPATQGTAGALAPLATSWQELGPI